MLREAHPPTNIQHPRSNICYRIANMTSATTKLTGRRNFLRSAAGMGAAFWANETLDGAVQNTNTNSRPSDLKITDLRIATVARAPMTCPLIRIDTNQGIYGLGEVRDGASKTYALFLKSRLLGETPATWTRFFARSNNLEPIRGRRAGCAASRWRCGTWPARPTMCPSTRCWAASSATRSAAMPTPPNRTIRRNTGGVSNCVGTRDSRG